MEIVVVIVILMIVLSIKGIFDKRNKKKWLIDSLIANWGKEPEQEYTEEKFKSLQYYYNNKYSEEKENRFFLDSITWNDLNMDELFFMMNATRSSMGEEYLWAVLHELQLDEKILLEREAIISYFQKNAEERLKLQTAFAMIGKNKKISIYEYIDRIQNVRKESNIGHFVVLAGMILSAALLLYSVTVGGLLLIACISYNIISYYKRKGEIAPYFSSMTYLIRMLENAEKISKEEMKELNFYYKTLREKTAVLKKFRKGAPVVAEQNPVGDMMGLFLDYVRILFHTDLIRFNLMLKEYFDKRNLIIDIFEIIGFLDAMCAAASFREMVPKYCVPEFSDMKEYNVTGLYHPFLTEPVPADLVTEHSVLITGSNASGKSTFIKAAAMNAILAQTIHTVCAASYHAAFFKVMTSMALSDNLFGNESYYIVEIKSLKRILNETDGGHPVLCFIDEVLRGTNTVERIAASSRILYSIAEANALCFAATHDIELTYMLEPCFENYHFEEQIMEDRILFDYKLKKGRATTQNAIALLGMLGYPEEIIKNARETAAHFLSEGEWRKIAE